MATETSKLTGDEAIEAFLAAGEGKAVKVWSCHPVQKPMGSTDWGSEGWVSELLAEDQGEAEGYDLGGTWTGAEWDGKELDLTADNGWRYTLWHVDDPTAGRPKVAYDSAHCGFEWEDESVQSDALKTLLDYFRWDDAALAEFGLATCDDYLYGDDGGFWLVADADKFAATVAKCQALDERWEDLDADAVLAYLRDGTEPESE